MMCHRLPGTSLLHLLLALALAVACWADGGRPAARAVRPESRSPRVDGHLDDAVWQRAPVQGGFLQREPVEGAPASERTAFQVAYDEEALYVAIRCHDTDAKRILARLTRRDGDIEADWVRVSLDPRLDRQSGYWFSVYASGSVVDGVYAGDRSMDTAWDGVWEAETALTEDGWTAEYRIPYHALRFAPREIYTWGLNVERHISRKQERAQWSLVRPGDTGLVSRFGQLEGIDGIHPPLHLEAVPYAMGRATVDGGADWFGNMGADLRYGITSSTSVNAAINPDFGQVEADPATLNLTAFEEFHPEQRPFFVEGAAIFENWDYDVFHSRRIGRRPGRLAIPGDAVEVDRPEATTILGAVKLTGKTEGKTTFGVLDAVTSEEHADYVRLVDGAPRQAKHLVEPLTNHFVGRVAQDVLGGTSRVGAMATAVNRRDAGSAYVGALDWDLRYRDDTYMVTGSLIGSRSGAADERHSGYIAHLELDKVGGWVEVETGAAALSRHVDLNDLGYLRRGDLLRHWYDVALYRHNPWGPFQRADVGLDWELEWNHDGQLLSNGFGWSNWADLRSYWRVHLHFGREFSSFDDDDVRRGGPVIECPAENWVHAQVESDPRRRVSFSVRPEYRRHDGGRSNERGLRVSAEARPWPNTWLFVEPRYSNRLSDAQWVGAFDDAAGGPAGSHYVYGELCARTLDLTARAQVSFTPELSLELYLQPFIAIGDYRAFKELVEPESYRFRPYDLGENRDFHRRSLNSNLVLRWEFRPGSMLFLVWSQSRGASLLEATDDDLELRPLSRLGSVFTDDGSNVFLAKVNYWYGP